MTRKTVVSMFLFALAQVASSTASSSQLDSAAYLKMLILNSKVGSKKLVTIRLTQFQYFAGRPVRTEAITQTLKEQYQLLGPDFLRIMTRHNWLRSQLESIEHLPTNGAVTMSIPGNRKPIAQCITFGVEAVTVKLTNGTSKFLAIKPTSTGSIETFASESSKVPDTKVRIYSRNDFINPEDIDWFFGVKNFADFTH